MFSVIQDAQSAELSQKHVARRAKRLKVDQAELKLPRVVALDACQARMRAQANEGFENSQLPRPCQS